MLVNKEDYFEFTNGKNIALFGVNKETINFLKLRQESITHVIDFTINYRVNVKNILENNLDEIKIIGSVSELLNALTNKEFDVILSFEGGFPVSDYEETIITDISLIETIIKERYDDLIDRKGLKSEYTYQYSENECNFIYLYIIENYKMNILSAYYTQPIEDVWSDGEGPLDKHFIILDTAIQPTKIASDLFYSDLSVSELQNIDVVFVLGSDYAVGKSTYTMSKYNGFDNILLNDPFYWLTNPIIFMEIKAEDIKHNILKNLTRLIKRQKKRTGVTETIYVKIEGRIDEFAFGLPRDRGGQWGNFHEFFINHKFVIIIKNNEDMVRFNHTYNIFKKVMRLTDDKIDIYKNDPVTNILTIVEIDN